MPFREIVDSVIRVYFFQCPVFGNQFTSQNKNGLQIFDFVHPENIQQPMIQKVVDYFLNKGDNPCSANEALKYICVMEAFLQKNKYNK